jgi:hypothetical protein
MLWQRKLSPILMSIMKANNVIFLNKEGDKVCPLCNTIYHGKDIFQCEKCNIWMPHLNTSWVRSVTNLFLIKRILEIIDGNNKSSFTKIDLVNALVERKIIKVDLTRTDDTKYWSGSPSRRASEYIQIFKYLGIIKPFSKKEFVVTEVGKRIIRADRRADFVSINALLLSHFDPSNHYVEKRYSVLKSNYFLLALNLINHLNEKGEEVSIEKIGLAFMCKNSADYEKAKSMAVSYSTKELIQTIWGNSLELNRVVKGVFLRWLEQSRLVDINRKPRHFDIKISAFGKQILSRYFSKAFKVSDESTLDLISNDDTKYMDEELKVISELLVSTTDENSRFKLILSIKKSLTQKTGGLWEQYVYNHLSNLGLDPKWYKESQDFVNIQLPNNVINALSGGTRHNPDIIIQSPLFLVDPKDDVNKEMYKVQAYDGYATDNRVNGNALIVSKELMGKEQSERLSDLKKTCVIDKEALDLLVNNKNYLNKESIMRILGYQSSNGYYLNEELLLDKIDSLV